MILSHTPSCVVSPKEKEKKRNINNDLAILPSHDIYVDNPVPFFVSHLSLLQNVLVIFGVT